MWQLLIDAEGIVIGDKIEVECEDGSTEVMKLVKYTEKFVYLKDRSKETYRFRTDTLESKGNDLIIVGKVE